MRWKDLREKMDRVRQGKTWVGLQDFEKETEKLIEKSGREIGRCVHQRSKRWYIYTLKYQMMMLD